jgi:hypothetical protein
MTSLLIAPPLDSDDDDGDGDDGEDDDEPVVLCVTRPSENDRHILMFDLGNRWFWKFKPGDLTHLKLLDVLMSSIPAVFACQAALQNAAETAEDVAANSFRSAGETFVKTLASDKFLQASLCEGSKRIPDAADIDDVKDFIIYPSGEKFQRDDTIKGSLFLTAKFKMKQTIIAENNGGARLFPSKTLADTLVGLCEDSKKSSYFPVVLYKAERISRLCAAAYETYIQDGKSKVVFKRRSPGNRCTRFARLTTYLSYNFK